MRSHQLSTLTHEVQRLENAGIFVDLIKTSRGTVRIGSMPDIAKYLSQYGFREEIVVIPEWEGSMAGDNRTGEEFVLWYSQVRGDIGKHYVGTAKNVTRMYNHLDETFSFFFDAKRISIVKQKWLDTWFQKKIVNPVYQNDSLQINIKKENIVVSDEGQIIYNYRDFSPLQSCDDQVENILGQIPRDSIPRQYMEVTAVGTGNGFTDVVSSFIVRAGKEVIWIDPCGYPASALARHNIHWDDVSHILISHNHEDHVQGFSACIKRAEYTGRPLNLITSSSIYRILKKQFELLCPEFEKHVNFIPITPGESAQLGAIELKCRWNHHFLPNGTLGFKFYFGGKVFGFSGDTKFDENINAILKRDELLPQWFKSCDLVFHEVDFYSPGSVHTHWKQLEKLCQEISALVLCYHTPVLTNGPLPQVVEGKTYHLEALQ